MRREERVTVQGPVKKEQPDGMSHRAALFWLLVSLSQRGGGGCRKVVGTPGESFREWGSGGRNGQCQRRALETCIPIEYTVTGL